MRSAFNKDILRSITGSWGRFLAIVGIVALGCGFYAGLRMTAPDMDAAADAYYDATDLMDIRVVSTLGLTDADLEALRQLDGVEQAIGAYETDAMAELNGEQYAVRVHSLPYAAGGGNMDEDSAAAAEKGALNRLTLTEGRWPTAADECVISADNVMNSPVSLGDEAALIEGVQDLGEVLDQQTYHVVGFVHSPYYVSTTAMGSTSLGSGTIQQFMYVPSDDFAADLPFTEAFIKVADAEGEASGSSAYQDRVDEVLKEIEGIAPEREALRLDEVKAEAQEELEQKRQEYLEERARAEAKLADVKQQLDDAAAQIEASKAKLASGQADYDAGVRQLAAGRASADQQLADGAAQLDAQQAQLDASAAELDQAKAQLDAGWAAVAAMGVTPDSAAATVEALKTQLAALDPAAPGYDQQAAVLKGQIEQLETLIRSQAAYDEGRAQLESGAERLAAARSELSKQREAASDQFSAAQAKLDAASAELASGRAQLAEGEAEYADGAAEYEAEHAKALEGFADAEAQLADAQAQIDELEAPEWLVMDRTKNPGVVSFESDADRVDSIASFFPFIFFLVAALVALTTMTRMVEEERVLIGTFKALGYSRARITSKYLIYAAAASLIGAVVGIVALSLILPPIIMDAYAIIYSVPHGPIMPLDPVVALTAAGLGVGVTLIATWAAAAATLRETPALLMLPRAPKQGKRILLERIRPLWQHLSFSWKVTCRNIFRYKKRLVMTVIGIAGCTGLLLTGLGLHDAVNDIIDKQFGQTVLYNVEVTGEEGLTDEARHELEGMTQEHAFAEVMSMMASGPAKSDLSVSVITPEDAGAFQKLWVMRTRVGHEPLTLGPDSVILTEKTANLLGLSVGDDFTLAEQDSMGNATNTTYGLKVTGIMENYVANYVFLGQSVYEDTFGNTPDALTMFAQVGDSDGDHEAFRKAASAVEGVKTVAFNNETIDAYRKMLSSVNMIVVVLVVAAAALAFIVLYNLTNINITERAREIATLKVLGFTPHEVDMYIYRETIILTVLGALIGLIFGVVLESFVIVTAEVDYVMFGRDIHLLSFVIAFLVTILFAVVVMLTMRRKLANINMIESLKSIE